MTNQHQIIETASRHKSGVLAIPTIFDKYQGYNDFKRKRLKEALMQSNVLKSHSEALLALCMKPCMKATTEWCEAYTNI